MKPLKEVSTPTQAELAGEAVACMCPPRILLAEDDYELRTLLTEVLTWEGYDVVQAESGHALRAELAGQQLRGEPDGFDLVVSDIRMPGCTGLEALDGLRASDWQTRFLFITSFGDNATHTEAHRLGGTILDKPFQLDEFRDQVGALVSPGRYESGWSAKNPAT